MYDFNVHQPLALGVCHRFAAGTLAHKGLPYTDFKTKENVECTSNVECGVEGTNSGPFPESLHRLSNSSNLQKAGRNYVSRNSAEVG